MATYKGKLKQKTANGFDILHPETEADIVSYSGSIGGVAVTNVKDALDTIIATGVGVTGVKGDAESAYRTGNVNLTPANIGAQPAFTDGSATVASVSSDIVTLKAGVTQSGGAIANSTGADITLAKVAKTGAYSDLSGTPTIGNGTLTIQAEGTSKGTFTANQTGNTTVNITAADLGLTSALKFIGVGTTTQPTAGQYIVFPSNPPYYIRVTTTGAAEQVAAQRGNVVIIGDKEYLCTEEGAGSAATWEELGDESSFALKSITISAGTGLTGGGSLEQNRTISLANNYGDTKNPYGAKPKNTVLAGPDGSAGHTADAAPTFRALVADDLPDNYGDTKNPYASKTKNYVLAAPVDSNGAPTFRQLQTSDFVSSGTMSLGSLVYGDVAGSGLVALNVGTNGKVLKSDGNVPVWGDDYGTAVTLNGVDKNGTTATIYAPESAITTSTAKRYLVGSSSTTSVATENTNASVYMQSGKLYSNNTEVVTGPTGVTQGTYSAVTVNTSGLVTAGAQVLAVIENGGSTTGLATNGWYFEKDATA